MRRARLGVLPAERRPIFLSEPMGGRSSPRGGVAARPGFAETDLLFKIDANARKIAAELPEVLPCLEAYGLGEAYTGVLMLICWGRKV